MKVKVLVVEDEAVFLHRLCAAVQGACSLALCGAARTLVEARDLIDRRAPDVVLVDLALPDGSGIDVIRHARASAPACDAIVVTMFGGEQDVVESIRAGATGYLLKDAMPRDIAAAIVDVRQGGSPISPAIARRLLVSMRQTTGAAASAPGACLLSERETEILRLVAKGLTFKEVGAALEISSHTVATHVKRSYQKLAVHSRGEAVYEASQLGLL